MIVLALILGATAGMVFGSAPTVVACVGLLFIGGLFAMVPR